MSSLYINSSLPYSGSRSRDLLVTDDTQGRSLLYTDDIGDLNDHRVDWVPDSFGFNVSLVFNFQLDHFKEQPKFLFGSS